MAQCQKHQYSIGKDLPLRHSRWQPLSLLELVHGNNESVAVLVRRPLGFYTMLLVKADISFQVFGCIDSSPEVTYIPTDVP